MAVDAGWFPIGLLPVEEVIELVTVVGLSGVIPACEEGARVLLWLAFELDLGEVAEEPVYGTISVLCKPLVLVLRGSRASYLCS